MNDQRRPSFDPDDIPDSPAQGPTLEDLLRVRWSRRGFLQGLAGGALAGGALALGLGQEAEAKTRVRSTLGFKEVAHGLDERLHVPEGHEAQVVIRWGDPVLPGAPSFDPGKPDADAQAQQFGYNNDFVAFFPLPQGSKASDHGLLFVNHEYSDAPMMFPGSPQPKALSEEWLEADMMANGLSIVEVKRDDQGRWSVVPDSKYARRITPETPTFLRGPAAGHARMKTPDSSDGVNSAGTFANCAGGVTPWGTVLTAEENIQYFFVGEIAGLAEEKILKRFGFRNEPTQPWGLHGGRFNLARSPQEPNHFGWIVEVDPYDPNFVPRKHTALGRFKHEGCGLTLCQDGRVAAYMGDDQQFEYVYRFVSEDAYDPTDREGAMKLLDSGTLSVAQFFDDGTLVWHPLVFGQGPLTPSNGFGSQADVVIDARRAADLVGATRMDRPEDVEVNPKTGSVFVMLTKNHARKADETPAANPRAQNLGGHILELFPPGGDHAAERYRWEVFLLAGDKTKPEQGAKYNPATSRDGWFYCPDNCTFDNQGRLWIGTDGSGDHGVADGVWACDVEGSGRALTRHFLRAPIGAEVTGPFFTPDNTTFFCSIQHPAQDTSFDAPSTRWPDFDPKLPPRPSVIAVTRKDRKPLG